MHDYLYKLFKKNNVDNISDDGLVFLYEDYFFDLENLIVGFQKDLANNNLYHNIDINKYVNDTRKKVIGEFNNIHSLYINPTWNCSRGCDYCYAQTMNNKLNNAQLSVEVLSKKIDEIEKKKNTTIDCFRMFGGEPLEAENILDIVSYLLPKAKQCLCISTGSLDLDMLRNLQKIVKNNNAFSLSIGIDIGCKESPRHITQNVVEFIKECMNIFPTNKIAFRCNICNTMDVNTTYRDIYECFDLVGKPIPMSFGVISDTIDSRGRSLIASPEQTIALLLAYNDLINKNIIFYRSENASYLKSLYYTDPEHYVYLPNYNKCGIGEKVLGIDPKGNLSVCHMGFIYDYTYDLNKNETNVNKNNLLYNKYCDTCNFRHTCGYGCPFRYSYDKSFPGVCILHILQQKILFEQKIKNKKPTESFESLFKVTSML